MTHRLDEARDADENLTHKMCCICFEFVPVEQLWTCVDHVKWDMCRPCGTREGCTC